jgi:hypothetical protein
LTGRDFSVEEYDSVLRNEYIKAIGKHIATIGNKRSTKYVMDDQVTGEELVNNYFDGSMTELDQWLLYKDIAEFIESGDNGVRLDKEIINEFRIELELLNEMNSNLIVFNSDAALDPFNENSQGIKYRLKELTMNVIQNKVNELEELEAKKLREEKHKQLEKARASRWDKKSEDNKNLIPLDPETKKQIQLKLVELIYSDPDSRMNQSKIAFDYQRACGNNIKYSAIESMLRNVPGVSKNKDSYEVKNITEAIKYLDPFKAKVRIEVIFRDGTDDMVKYYKNMRLSRSIGEYKVYVLEDWNTYDLYTQIIQLMLNGASIDKSYTEKVSIMMLSNMKEGKKSIL